MFYPALMAGRIAELEKQLAEAQERLAAAETMMSKGGSVNDAPIQ